MSTGFHSVPTEKAISRGEEFVDRNHPIREERDINHLLLLVELICQTNTCAIHLLSTHAVPLSRSARLSLSISLPLRESEPELAIIVFISVT